MGISLGIVMNITTMNKQIIFLLSILVVGALADDIHDVMKDVVNLDGDTFYTEVAEKPHFVLFFAPWCGYCKRVAPKWQKLAEKYNDADDQEVVIAKVDCTIERALCSEQGVRGYPTMKFYKSGAGSGLEYNGRRDFDKFVAFIDEQMGRSAAK